MHCFVFIMSFALTDPPNAQMLEASFEVLAENEEQARGIVNREFLGVGQRHWKSAGVYQKFVSRQEEAQ